MIHDVEPIKLYHSHEISTRAPKMSRLTVQPAGHLAVSAQINSWVSHIADYLSEPAQPNSFEFEIHLKISFEQEGWGGGQRLP